MFENNNLSSFSYNDKKTMIVTRNKYEHVWNKVSILTATDKNKLITLY